ncbi:MAG TPA: HEAT repeat domain-containing protein [Vicinamibacterales bacterium]|nr:HEAT repeat domain-containing protein [Vicinamibacterales bacterium]
MRTTLALLTLAAALPFVQAAQQPLVQNGRVETRAATSIDRELSAVGSGADPVWVAWREPMIDGERNMCSTWFTDRTGYIRGDMLEPSQGPAMNAPQIAAPTGPVALEGGTGIVVLVRVINGRMERLRSVGDDCPMDAGGRTFYWLTGISSTESLRFLENLLKTDGQPLDEQNRFREGALSAIAVHRDPAADAILDRLAASSSNADTRRRAASYLGSMRGAHGFATLRSLIAAEKDPATRRSLVTSLGQTRQPGTADALLALAQNDPDARLRAEAVYWYPQRAGVNGLAATLAIIEKDTNDDVKRRAVSGLSRLPNDQAVPTLIDLAKSTKSTEAVRKEAVSALGQSKDPRALAFLEQILR